MYIERDPIQERLQRADRRLIMLLTHLVTSEPGAVKPTLDEVRAAIHARSEAEAELLFPALARLPLRADIQCLLDDCRTTHEAQARALVALQRTRRKHPLWKLRALALRDLVAGHRAHVGSVLVPTLRSHLPQALYRSIVGTYAEKCLDVRRSRVRLSTLVTRAA